MLDTWLEARRGADLLEVEPLRWVDNREWSFDCGVLRHRTGGFFSICGVELQGEEQPLDGRLFPMIDQPEVGMLGFLVRRGPNGVEWLLQAKAEPGNVGAIQIGPSVQATRSNYNRLHGGAATAYLDEFADANVPCLTRLLQSEQGSRFLGKYNLNIVRLISDAVELAGPAWIWMGSDLVRAALARDFTVNTDARSVIASTDWSLLAAETPVFAPRHDGKDEIREHFRTSYRQANIAIRAALARLGSRRAASIRRQHAYSRQVPCSNRPCINYDVRQSCQTRLKQKCAMLPSSFDLERI